MQQYLDIVKDILENGEKKPNRTGIDTIVVPGVMFKHDMSAGFPLLTTKKTPFRLVASELEFFIKGITDKKWLQDRGNHIWDEWASPKKAPYGHDEESKKRMASERDLGPIYGWQWRHFNAEYKDYNTDYTNQGVDQLKNVVGTLKKNPTDRRIIISAWNPSMLDQMALPPCHFCFQITTTNDKLNLFWSQRSIDTMLGLPFNIASYALLLHLLAKESGLKEGTLVGFLSDTQIYVNHVEGAKEQLTRDPNKYPLPTIKTNDFTSIFDWQSEDTELINYQSYPRISFEIAV
ncbi:thymidylate synthase [Candidatus Falkowbacteria bacterium]|nr:thymidylate synthase [Candidatus Falkowbacteria bacterium]